MNSNHLSNTTNSGHRLLALIVGGVLAGVVFALTLTTLYTPPVAESPTWTQVFVQSAMPAPELGVVVDRNLRVIDVVAGSAAEKAGLHLGDQLQSFDNTPLLQASQATGVVRQTIAGKQGQPLQIRLVRAGQILTLSILPTLPSGRRGQPTPTAVPVDNGYL